MNQPYKHNGWQIWVKKVTKSLPKQSTGIKGRQKKDGGIYFTKKSRKV